MGCATFSYFFHNLKDVWNTTRNFRLNNGVAWKLMREGREKSCPAKYQRGPPYTFDNSCAH